MKYLRTLTIKSTLGFGKYSDMKVGNVLKLSSGTWYLVWVYYNCSMINFCDEVMEQLMIRDDFIIKKPGVDPDLYDKYLQIAMKKTFGASGLNKHIIKQMNKSRQKGKKAGFNARDKIRFSKRTMAWKNQGH